MPLGLAAALVLFLGLRAAILVSNFDSVCVANYEISTMGSIARLIGSGMSGVPLYGFYDNCGGHLVTGLLAAPLYAVFGPSYLSLKLVPLLLGSATLVLAWFVIDRHFDRRAANLAALLLAITPMTLAKFSVVAMGSHYESLFFQVLVLALFLRVHRGVETGRGARLFAASAAAGFAVFFYFGSIALIIILLGMHVAVRGLSRSCADARLAIPGFLLGLSPLLWVHWATQGRPGRFLEGHLSTAPARGLERIAEVLTLLPRASGFSDLGPIPGRVADWTFFACFVGAWVLSLPRLYVGARRVLASHGQRTSEPRAVIEAERLRQLLLAPFLLHLPLVVGFFAATKFELKPYPPPMEVSQFRYLVPHLAWAVVLIALATSACLSGRGVAWRRGLGAGLGSLAVVSSLFTLPAIDWSWARPNRGPCYQGFSAPFYSRFVLAEAERRRRVATADTDPVAEILAPLSPAMRTGAYFGLGHFAAWLRILPEAGGGVAVSDLDLSALLEPYAAEHHIDVARGVGSFLRRMLRSSPAHGDRIARLLAERMAAEPMATYVVEGLCLDFGFQLERKTEDELLRTAMLESMIPAALQTAWRRGQGIQCGRLLRRGFAPDRRAVLDTARTVPDADQASFWRGVGWGLADACTQAPLPPDLLGIPSEHELLVLAGIGAALRHLHGVEACADVGRGLYEALAPDRRAALERGMRWSDYPAAFLP